MGEIRSGLRGGVATWLSKATGAARRIISRIVRPFPTYLLTYTLSMSWSSLHISLHGVPVFTKLLCLVITAHEISHEIYPQEIALICVVKVSHPLLIVFILTIMLVLALLPVTLITVLVTVVNGNLNRGLLTLLRSVILMMILLVMWGTVSSSSRRALMLTSARSVASATASV